MWEEQNKNNIIFITEWNLCWKKLQSRSLVPRERVWWIKRQRTCKCYEKIDVFWQTNALILFKLAKVSNLASTAQWKTATAIKF